MTKDWQTDVSQHIRGHQLALSVTVMIFSTLMLGIPVFNNVTGMTEVMIGLVVWVGCLIVMFRFARGSSVDLCALWYLLAASATSLIFLVYKSVIDSESFRGFRRDAFVSAAGAGLYEEVFIRIIPLSLILLGWVTYRKILMITTSLIFGFAHVIAHVCEWQWTWVWIGNFFLKALSTALFGLILAMVIVKAGKWGIFLTPIVHCLNDWAYYLFVAPAGSSTYLQGDNRLSYVLD